MDRRSILITGINGFIGSNLEDYIKKKYPFWNVYGIDKKVKETKKKFKLDVQNKNGLKNVLLKIKPRYIFHLAGTTFSKDFIKLFLSNVYTTYILLETIQEINNYLPRIIIPSSAAEYGNVFPSKMPIEEETPLDPTSIYGFSKMMQTEISFMFVKKGLDIVIPRIFNIIGKGVPVNFSMGKFAYELALIRKNKKRPIIYTEDLDSKRDFLDIKNVCEWLSKIALYGKRGEVYNVCRGRSYRIRDLLHKLIKISGVKKIEIVENKKSNRDVIKNSFGSVEKLKKIVKPFRPISIEKSLRNTYFYYFSEV